MQIAILAVVLGACGGGHTESIDASVAGCTTCSAPTPVCDTDKLICVQCTATDVTACTGTTPACVSDTCAACSADTDCSSGACLGDGSCADPASVLWVTRDVSAGTCTQADKCTLAIALSLVSATKTVIHLDPLGYTFGAGFVLGETMTIVGIGASIAVTNDTVFTVNGGVVKLDFLQLGGAPEAPATEGIECTNATLTARRIGVAYTATVGINASGCFLRLERSTLHDNLVGAMVVGGGGTFNIFDNMIVRNGGAAAAAGGVELLGTIDPLSRLEFNTIADNQAGTGNTGGVSCDQTGAAANNLIVRNTPSETSGACTYPTSLVQDTIAGLAFVSPDVSPYDYHIGAGSTAIDQATTVSSVVIDVDDDVRPQGPAKDIGADEFKP